MGRSKDNGNPRMQTATIYCIDTAFLLQAKKHPTMEKEPQCIDL